MSNAESVPQPEEMTPEEGGVPGGDAEARVDEEAKVPSPASVPGETKDVGADRKRENSPEIERGDFKRLCATLEKQLPSVLEKLHEGYRLTGEALQAVNENTALERQIQKDLSELARSHGSEHVSQKYFLSITQENLKKAENVEWQIAGPRPRADQHVSLKTVLSKWLDKLGNIHVGQQAMVAGIKEGNAAIKEGNTALTEAIKAGSSSGIQCSTHTSGGTILRNARIFQCRIHYAINHTHNVVNAACTNSVGCPSHAKCPTNACEHAQCSNAKCISAACEHAQCSNDRGTHCGATTKGASAGRER